MDREIPLEEQRKERNKTLLKFAGTAVVLVVVVMVATRFARSSVSEGDLNLSLVETGTIEVSLNAAGTVVPAFEEIINSPVNSRILEVYVRGGDSVEVGTPLLKLDLQSIETDYNKLLDEEKMRRYKLDQLKVTTKTKLNNMAMQIKVSSMKLERMAVELHNEHYLDSLGAGTTDKVRETALSYEVAGMELDQQKQQYEDEIKVAEAELRVQELDFDIFQKSLREMKRTLDDAQIRSPRRATLTYIDNNVGAQVRQGDQVAVISDLSHFKVEGEISDLYADKLSAGKKALVRIGNEKLEGTVSSVTPLSKNGVISFTVQLEKDKHPRLRPGLKTDLYVMDALKEEVMRIANGPYYMGPGSYEMYVVQGNQLVKKQLSWERVILNMWKYKEESDPGNRWW